MEIGLPTRARFGAFELDLKAGELHKGNRTVLLQEQPFQVLRMLVQHHGEVVLREEIQKKLWPNDTVVEFDHVINTAIKKLRQALGDSAERPKYIETVARRGYRLVMAVDWVEALPTRSPVDVVPPPETGSFAANLIGKKVSHYRVLEVLGGGGMGIVFKGEDIKLGRRVALKFLAEELATDPAALGRFEREAKAASALNHPNICTIYEVEEHEGRPFLVMELLEGQTLREHIPTTDTPLAMDEIFDLALQISDALDAAHQKGIIHRDIKPANVFITTRGEAKILDFGLAKLVETEHGDAAAAIGSGDGASIKSETKHSLQLTRTGAALGTACYMSPEQVQGEELDARTDLFSFGLVLYEMATGQQAFGGETAIEVQQAILHRTPEPAREFNSKLPPKLEEIINKALEKDRNARYRTALELRTDLKDLQNDISRLIPNELTSRSRWRLVAALFLLVAIVSAIVIARRMGIVSYPSFERLTFERGTMHNARFTPDGNTIIYSAAWDGKPSQIFWTRPGSRVSSPVDVANAGLLAISAKNEVAALLNPYRVEGSGIYAGTLATLPLSGGSPREILNDVGSADFSPDGRLAVVDYNENRTRCRLEFPIGNVLYESDYASIGFISDVRVSPRGDHIAFIDHPLATDEVAMVDLTGKKTTLSHNLRAYGIAWSGDGNEIWLSAEGPGGHGTYAVTLSGKQRLIFREPEAMVLQDLSHRGRLLAIHSSEHSECRAHLAGDSNERDLTWLANSNCKAISADGKTVLLETDGTVYIRRADASSAIRLGDGFALGLSPDGKYALSLVPGAPPKLVLLPIVLGEPQVLPRGPIEEYDPIGGKWLLDGRRIVFVAREKGHDLRVYLQDIDGGQPHAITPEKRFAYTPPGLAVSPDGKFVIFTAGNEDRFFAYPIDGGEPRLLAGLKQGDWPIVWSADGSSLFVHQAGDAAGEVYAINPMTGRRQLWKTFMPPDPAGVDVVHPIVTPDGQSYFYNYERRLTELYTVSGMK